MDPLAAIKVTFFQECEEQLAELETGLMAMNEGDQDPETVNAVFRAVHSIKGGAGAFSLTELVKFAHVFETVLDELRSGRLDADAKILGVMLRAADVLADLVRASRDGGQVDDARSGQLIEELEGISSGGGASAGATDDLLDLDFQPVRVEDGEPSDEIRGLDIGEAIDFEISAVPRARRTVWFKPSTGLYKKANEPAVLLRELASLAPAQIFCDANELPTLDELNAEQAYLGWRIAIETADESAIRDVFDFVDGDCELKISSDPADAEPEAAAAAPMAVGSDGLPDIAQLIAMATGKGPAPVKASVLAEVPTEVLPPAAAKPANVISLAERTPPPPTEPVAAEPASRTPDASAPTAPSPQTIRVDLERVDRLIDLVGELVINQAMLAQRVIESGLARSSGIAVGLDDLELLTREIQDSVMAIRAQPVKSVFQRMPRLAREVAAATGKEVRLVIEGEGTEVDKTVIERLTDPITHMIRNAIDHGLEGREDRMVAGKPLCGTVRLSALHRSGRIVIEVADDGGGINRKRVRAIAVDRGLVMPEAQLSDEEIDNLIFMPGFSTASTVSDISGRGVGMDVVRRSIQALGGRISIASRPGLGSTFTLSLPLTLAVLDGMVVSLEGQTFVLPITTVMETLQPKASEIRRLHGNMTLLLIRDQYVPLLDVGQRLGYRTEMCEPTTAVALLVEGEDGRSAALLVDTILGQRQVVIKSLEQNYRRVAGIAASTILGDGRVALILDVDAVLDQSNAELAAPQSLLATG